MSAANNRSLLREVAYAYVHARERWQRAQQRGEADRADEAYSRMQAIEQGVQVTELNGAWR